jgi:hypothetical protein
MSQNPQVPNCRGVAPNVSRKHAVVFAAQEDAAEAALNNSFLAAEAANQLAAKTMERRQLFSNCVST